MKLVDIVLGIAHHIIASISSFVFVSAVPIALYGAMVIAGIALTGFMGSPLNFIIVPVLSLVLGIALALLYVPIALLFQLLRTKLRLPFWLPILLAVLASLLCSLLVAGRAYFSEDGLETTIFLFAIIVAFSLYVSTGFCIYWLAVILSEKVIRLLRNGLAGQQPQ